MQSAIERIRRFIGKPEGFFAGVGLLFGLAFLLIVPPFMTPDEAVHLYRAYEVSEMKLPQKNEQGKSGSMLPQSIKETEDRTESLTREGYEAYDIRLTKSALFDIPLQEEKKSFYVTGGSPMYMPLSYLPHALIAGVGQMFDLPVIVTLYALRLLNLCIWLAVGFVSIKLFPWKKWSLAGVCLLPVVVFQTISVGLDATVFASALLFMAIIFKTIADKSFRLTAKRLAILGILASIMVLGKSVLAALLPLLFLIDKKQLPARSPLLIKVGLVVAPVVIYIAWGAATSGMGSAVSAIDHSDSAAQIQALFYTPWQYILQLLNTLLLNSVTADILASSIVGNFGWLNAALPPFVVAFGYCFIAFLLTVSGGTAVVIKRRQRLIMAGLALGYVLLTFLAMYIYFTPPESTDIKGVNGRYFIPLLILLVPLLSSQMILMKPQQYIRAVKIGAIALLLASVLTLVIEYYAVVTPT